MNIPDDAPLTVGELPEYCAAPGCHKGATWVVAAFARDDEIRIVYAGTCREHRGVGVEDLSYDALLPEAVWVFRVGEIALGCLDLDRLALRLDPARLAAALAEVARDRVPTQPPPGFAYVEICTTGECDHLH